MTTLEACRFGSSFAPPWHAYDPDDPDELTLCGLSIARATRLWHVWDDQYEFERCKRCTHQLAAGKR